MMAEDCRDKKEKKLFAGMIRAMSGGAMLSGAMREADAFPDYMTEMIGLGERTGNVDNTLKALGDYYEKQARMRESVKSAVIYPAVLLVMMLLVVGVLVIKVLPVFADVYGQMGASMPALALTIMEAGVAVGTHWYIAAGVVVLIVIGATAISRTPSMGKGIFQKDEEKNRCCAHGPGTCYGNAKRYGYVGGVGGGTEADGRYGDGGDGCPAESVGGRRGKSYFCVFQRKRVYRSGTAYLFNWGQNGQRG